MLKVKLSEIERCHGSGKAKEIQRKYKQGKIRKLGDYLDLVMFRC